ncbi:MAG TPA: ATP-dependent helicase, partial [Candidatus Andersenbacteria bacterium]|nr:ATP-dependent helicase [Candidatus Andersenbacteria bacterium]
MAQRTKEVQRVKAAASFAELYGRLNDGQRAAVDAIEGPVMVLAGPGTGKTQVLTMRVANILQRTDMAPWNILCLTFTESAALEMRQRLLKIIGEAAYQVRISTFHAFCNDVIQDWPEKFPFSGSEVLAEVERVEVFRRLLDQLLGTSALKPFGQPYLFLPDVMRAVQLLKQESITVERAREAAVTVRDFLRQSAAARTAFIRLRPAERDAMAVAAVREQLRAATDHEALRELIDQPFVRLQEAVALAENKREEGKARTALKNSLQRLFDKWERHAPRQIELLNVYDAYQAWLDQHSRFDYEDMIMRVVEALQGDDALLAHYQEQFQYVLVDEFQDTNGSQNEVVRLLGSFYPNPNIFVVGDDKQSIFRFQGASLENLLNFYERYRADVQIISLHDNYRSGQLILDAAGAVITHNRSLLARHVPNVTEELRARTDTPASLAWYAFDTEDEENFFVATTIQGLLEVGVAADEIAVLYRFNRDADSLVDLLLRMRVPVRLEAGENVLQDPRVRQFLQLLTFIAQPHRSDVLADILQFDFLSLNALDVLRVIHAAAERGGRRALLEVLASESELTGAGVREPARFVQLATQLAQWHQLHTNCTPVQLFDVVLSESGLLDFILREEHNLPILHRLSTLYQELVRLNRAQHDLRAADFVSRLNVLQESGLALTASPWQTRKAAVRLMTAHKAKGREFQHVFIMRLRDKHWGNVRERARVELPPGLLRHDLVPGQSGNEDERRLFYVALTRAKQRLYLSYAHLDAAGREQAESQFVRELPAGLVEVVDTVPTEEAAAVRLSTARLAPATVVAADVREWLGE